LLAPIRDRLEPWDSDVTLFPGLDVRVLPGHTPGSTSTGRGTLLRPEICATVGCPLLILSLTPDRPRHGEGHLMDNDVSTDTTSTSREWAAWI